ncbi:hypothetical protein [Pseudofulvibacter geojedonensis]|uniref:Helicase ATP-binding domain-containing protein n=1 Tax=Pseudofulvibacter geojedonensis TaxID=1123758 RepID=A0ABW3I318_9FLAO
MQNTKFLTFDSQFISGAALDILTDATANKYIIKGSTGIGGTTAILNYQKGNYIIISPNIGMIKGKEEKSNEGEFESDKQLFIFSDTKDTWADALKYFEDSDKQNLIINTTPDQILSVYDSAVYMKLINIPIFIDEVHAYSQDASYRDSMGAFMELVYNEWKATFTLSTATPVYQGWDIPVGKEIKYFNVSRANQQPKYLDISYNKKDVHQFVYDQYEKDKLVIIFTNNKNLHTSFKDLRVANLVGETLKLKLAPNNRGILLDELNYDETDVLMLSSSYFAGFDIEQECSILIVSDQKNDAHKINVNNIVQCYGRCRTKVHQALFVNLCRKNAEYPLYPSQLNAAYKAYKRKVEAYQVVRDTPELKYDAISNGYITSAGYINRMKSIQELLIKINDYHLYNHKVLKQSLEAYGFVIGEYINESEKIYKEIGTTFSEQMQNLINRGSDQLLKDYYNIKYKLRNKEDGTFSPKLGLMYLTAHLLAATGANRVMNKLNNKRVYVGEFYKSVNAFLCINGNTKYHVRQLSSYERNASKNYYDDAISELLKTKSSLTDDWQMLYTIHKIGNNKFPDTVARGLLIQQTFHNQEIYLKYKDTGSNKSKNARNAIIKLLKSEEIELTKNEKDRLKKSIQSNYKRILEGKPIGKYNTRESLKKLMKEAIIFCLTKGKCGKAKRVGFREYSPLTALPNALRTIIPIKYVEVDLTSANPQFIDTILETNKAKEVYRNLMKKRKISRYEAKWVFNSTINNHRLSKARAIEVYCDAGYSKNKAKQLAELTAGVERGSFFKLMTEAEAELIAAYNSIIDGNGMRFHDAIVFKASDIIDKKIVLPTSVLVAKTDEEGFTELIKDKNDLRKVQFHVGYYNVPGVDYEGYLTTKSVVVA